jgi:hypothetical protein
MPNLCTQLLAECLREPGLLTTGETSSVSSDRALNLLGNVELTFLGYPFERLGRAFDPILAVIAIGRKQPEHLIGAARGRSGNITGSKIHGLSNGEFMLQRPLHHAKRRARCPARLGGLIPDRYIA